VGFLEAGAAHVVLCERYAPFDDAHNATLLPRFARYLTVADGPVRPRPDYVTLLQGDIREIKPLVDVTLCDFVVSTSVYEHLDDVDGITCALAALTQPDGLQLHYVDLRDHFFKFPFEMLAYSEKTWRGWLDPTSHHNRFRIWDYRAVFEKYFESVGVDILARDEEAFRNIQNRIRSEFRSGDAANDSVTLILVAASHPHPLR
jgi:SAM-dependent methyltransferase